MGCNLAVLLFLWVATLLIFEQLEAPFKLFFNQCFVDLRVLSLYHLDYFLKKTSKFKKGMKVGSVSETDSAFRRQRPLKSWVKSWLSILI